MFISEVWVGFLLVMHGREKNEKGRRVFQRE